MRISLFIFYCILITTAQTTFAQFSTNITGEGVTIILSPQYPNPGEEVTASIDDYSITNSGVSITWFFDGLSVPAATNARTINFIAPAIGAPLKILARLNYANGQTLEVKRTITPLYLDIIIEPQTYIPFFYTGRALPTNGSIINIQALLQDENGEIIANNYSYNWSIGNKSVYGGPRKGGKWAQISSKYGQSTTVTIAITDKNGVLVARKLVAIPMVPVQLHFYEINTLLGLKQKEIGSELILSGASASIRAVPYYLDKRSTENNLFTQWSINNKNILNENSDPFEINLTRGTAGTARVGFKIINRDILLQKDEAAFSVKF